MMANNVIKVLLADDDETLLDLYKERFVAEGFEVVTARDGNELMARAVETHPDIILTDLKMPNVNGFDSLDIIKSTSETREIPTLVLTAFPNPEFKERVLKAGVLGYLVKSEVTPAQVVEKIREVVESQPEKK